MASDAQKGCWYVLVLLTSSTLPPEPKYVRWPWVLVVVMGAHAPDARSPEGPELRASNRVMQRCQTRRSRTAQGGSHLLVTRVALHLLAFGLHLAISPRSVATFGTSLCGASRFQSGRLRAAPFSRGSDSRFGERSENRYSSLLGLFRNRTTVKPGRAEASAADHKPSQPACQKWQPYGTIPRIWPSLAKPCQGLLSSKSLTRSRTVYSAAQAKTSGLTARCSHFSFPPWRVPRAPRRRRRRRPRRHRSHRHRNRRRPPLAAAAPLGRWSRR